MLRTALFRSEKTNERNTDLAETNLTQNLLSGKRHTDGIEFETAGKITSRWDIFGGLALMNARIDAATGDQARVKEQFGKLGRTCKACHDDYRSKD